MGWVPTFVGIEMRGSNEFSALSPVTARITKSPTDQKTSAPAPDQLHSGMRTNKSQLQTVTL
jgi:hypothetical protein